jgi:hypothetical protein
MYKPPINNCHAWACNSAKFDRHCAYLCLTNMHRQEYCHMAHAPCGTAVQPLLWIWHTWVGPATCSTTEIVELQCRPAYQTSKHTFGRCRHAFGAQCAVPMSTHPPVVEAPMQHR